MVYVDKFTLPLDFEEKIILQRMAENGGAFGYIDNVYPCNLFKDKQLREVDFEPITVIYGGNGSGKSTLLNLIAQRLALKRIAPYNDSELFDRYAQKCAVQMGYDDYGKACALPRNSRIITSDDIFDYMLTVRSNNSEIADTAEQAKLEHARLKYGSTLQLKGLQDYEDFKMQVEARRKSKTRRTFIKEVAGEQVKLNSNGETAMQYFQTRLENDTLYCLDEPENSMSPRLQLELVKSIEKKVRYCGCQLIIATHSPFLLSLNGAKIYDLDSTPVTVKKWWELENSKTYYEFFLKHKVLFEND